MEMEILSVLYDDVMKVCPFANYTDAGLVKYYRSHPRNEIDRQEIIEEIVNRYERTIEFIIRQLTPSKRSTGSFDSDDLHQQAVIAVIDAIETYDGRKAQFGTWLYTQVYYEVLDYVRHNGRFFSLTTYGERKHGEIISALKRYYQEYQKTPTFKEFVEWSGLKESLVCELWDAAKMPFSFEDDNNLEEQVPASDSIQSSDDSFLAEEVRKACERLLSPKELLMVYHTFGIDGYEIKSASELAEDMFMSVDSVRKHLNDALNKLRCSEFMKFYQCD